MYQMYDHLAFPGEVQVNQTIVFELLRRKSRPQQELIKDVFSNPFSGKLQYAKRNKSDIKLPAFKK